MLLIPLLLLVMEHLSSLLCICSINKTTEHIIEIRHTHPDVCIALSHPYHQAVFHDLALALARGSYRPVGANARQRTESSHLNIVFVLKNARLSLCLNYESHPHGGCSSTTHAIHQMLT